MNGLVQVNSLSKRYPAFCLENVSFSLREGAVTGLIGRNGAGKTTLLKSMLGFIQPDRGEVRFFGMDFEGNQQRIKQEIGYVAGSFGFYRGKRLSAITAVTAPFYDAWDDQVYRRCLKDFRLDERKTPAQLSEGMKVKYALTLALSHHARLLILDEPTSGLDPVSRDELLDVLAQLNREGTTILYSTHVTSDLDRCADDILYLRDGRLTAQGSLRGFVSAWRDVSMTEEEHQRADDSLLIGCRRHRDGWEALVRAEDAQRVPGSVAEADLESVMIHLERGCGE
ncbi:MAG: ABC transporter ATP-binding protein [Clostridia bacterium]|nr:ABC transporter ATP-binding protein [Clostridia bacterium]